MPATHASTTRMPLPPLQLDLDEAAARRARCLAELDDVDRELRAMWSDAFVKADFDEITRLVAASQAVHRAAVALRGNALDLRS